MNLACIFNDMLILDMFTLTTALISLIYHKVRYDTLVFNFICLSIRNNTPKVSSMKTLVVTTRNCLLYGYQERIFSWHFLN